MKRKGVKRTWHDGKAFAESMRKMGEELSRGIKEMLRNANTIPPIRFYFTKKQIEALAISHPDEMVKRGRKWYLNGVEVVKIELLKVPGKRKAVRK